MQGCHGCLPGDLGFLQMVREETRPRGITMIFDEVMTSRLSPGGLQEKPGVIPDMTTLGKYIGGGMSFGAFGGRRDIMELFDPTKPDHLPHAGTFNNNVLTMAAGVAGYGEVYTPEAAEELNDRGEKIRERLNAICQESRRRLPVLRHRLDDDGACHDAADQDGCRHRPRNQDAKELFYFDMVGGRHLDRPARLRGAQHHDRRRRRRPLRGGGRGVRDGPQGSFAAAMNTYHIPGRQRRT